MMSFGMVLVLAAVVAFFAFGTERFTYREYLTKAYREQYSPTKYKSLISEVEGIRDGYRINYEGDLEGMRTQADMYLTNLISYDMLPYWFGTKYGFSGTSRTPGKGQIACGYFVTTVLEDAGVKLNRTKLAQMASEDMIKTLLDWKSIRRYHRRPLKSFMNGIEEQGTGLYIVGLDTHTGFLIYDGTEMNFIHASGRFPKYVVKEPAEGSRSLANSKYRVVGKITGDERILKNWLRL